VEGDPGSDGADLLVNLAGEEAGYPPSAKAGEAANDCGPLLPEYLGGAVDVEEVDLPDAEMWIEAEVVGDVQALLSVILAIWYIMSWATLPAEPIRRILPFM
jgi:hypothetical protein